MSVVPLALTWALGGLVAAVVLPRLRAGRLGALLPLAASIVALVTMNGGAPDVAAAANLGAVALGRPAAGVALVCALAVGVALLLAPPADSGDMVVIGACGALASLALAAGTPVLWATCFVAGMAVMGVHWVTMQPSRTTLAAARIAPLGAAALLAAAPFLPVETTAVPPRAHLAGALLAVGIVGGLALVPLGGWVVGGARVRRGTALVPWALLLMPALVLTTQSLQELLPAGARTVLGGILLPAGSITAVLAGLNGLLVTDSDRYPRVLLADLGLVAMALASDQNSSRLGSLILLLTHLCVAPLTLQEPSAALARPRRLAWLALSGIPPSPAFWGRFTVTVGIAAGIGAYPLVVIIPALGLLLAVCVRAITAAPSAPRHATTSHVVRLAAWLPPLAGLAVGMLPGTSIRALFGVG